MWRAKGEEKSGFIVMQTLIQAAHANRVVCRPQCGLMTRDREPRGNASHSAAGVLFEFALQAAPLEP